MGEFYEPLAPMNLYEYLATIETNLIKRALATTKGNKAKCAALLGLQRTCLVEKIRKYLPHLLDEQRPNVVRAPRRKVAPTPPASPYVTSSSKVANKWPR